MKIHGLYLVKNEVDVVAESLEAASKWCDHIYVFDNGSADGTWELVRELAQRFPQIIPFKQDPSPFVDGLRADIFQHFKVDAADGDWWCRLDSDEFYIDDPRAFLCRVPDDFDVVWAALFSYYFTDRDAEDYRKDPANYGMGQTIEQRLRYYVNHWSEIRFFRHNSKLVWTRASGFPEALHRTQSFSRRIRVKHFAYRSPAQIDRRLATRRAAIEAGQFRHEAIAGWGAAVAAVRRTRSGFDGGSATFAGQGWEERVVAAVTLDYDNLNGQLVMNEELMPPIPDPTDWWQRFLDVVRRQLRKVPGLSRVRELERKWVKGVAGRL